MRQAVFLFFTAFIFSISTAQELDSLNIESPVFSDVETSASYPGGINEFYRFLAKNLRYPRLAQRQGVEGRVYFEYIVEVDGSLSDIKVVQGIGSGCDEEALRVIKLMPKWNPDEINGKPVRQKINRNILFKLHGPEGGKIINAKTNSDIKPKPLLASKPSKIVDLGLLVIGIERYYYYESKEPRLLQYAQPKNGIKSFIKDYLFALVDNPKYLPSSIKTYLQFTVFEDGELGNFILGDEANRNDTLFVETLFKLGNWEPSNSPQKNIFKLELRSPDRIPDEDAQFPGGLMAFNSYLKKSLKFPLSSQRLWVDGHVLVEFYVEIDGRITNARVIEGISDAYDNEALRVIKAMPKWTPHSKGGFPTRQRIQHPVVFEVNLRQKTVKD